MTVGDMGGEGGYAGGRDRMGWGGVGWGYKRAGEGREGQERWAGVVLSR